MLVPLPWTAAMHGRKLIAGTYQARAYINGKEFAYQPLVVTDESPKELTFKLPPAETYRGRVVHGVTGETMAAAFVMAWSSTSHNNLATLSADDWKLLWETPDNPPLDHPAIKRLRQRYGVQALARTDEDGRFEIVRQPDQEFYGLMAFEEDYVSLQKRTYYMKPDKPNELPAGDFPLYPAAKVLVRPVS